MRPWGRWEFRGRCVEGEDQFEAEVRSSTSRPLPFSPSGPPKPSPLVHAAALVLAMQIVATTEEEGVLLRAPTKEEGMQYFCRDSGYGRVVLSLYALEWDEGRGDFRRAATLVDAATSAQCAVEVRRCVSAVASAVLSYAFLSLKTIMADRFCLQLQVGGGPWWDTWTVKSKMSNTMKRLIRLPYKLRRLAIRAR